MIKENNYKSLLKSKLKEVQKLKPERTMKHLAVSLGVQATYLSKFMNHPTTHLNDDHLFHLSQLLDFNHLEMEYLFDLKNYESTEDTLRKKYLLSKIERYQKEYKLNVENMTPQNVNVEDEMSYLMDPLVLIIHLSLYVEKFKKNPMAICHQLSITPQTLKNGLEVLLKLSMIKVGDDLFDIKEVKFQKIHFGKDHSFMRVHQSIQKVMINYQLMKTTEEDKHSFLVTFNTSEDGFFKIKEEFKKFIKSVETIVEPTKPTGVYQLNFDLLKWL